MSYSRWGDSDWYVYVTGGILELPRLAVWHVNTFSDGNTPPDLTLEEVIESYQSKNFKLIRHHERSVNKHLRRFIKEYGKQVRGDMSLSSDQVLILCDWMLENPDKVGPTKKDITVEEIVDSLRERNISGRRMYCWKSHVEENLWFIPTYYAFYLPFSAPIPEEETQ